MNEAQSGNWIGPRPTAMQITAIVFVGTIGILIPGVQPIVLGALLAQRHISLSQLGTTASVELLTMGLAAALGAALLPSRRLRVIGIGASLVLALGNYLTPFAAGGSITALRALTGAAGGVLIGVTACMIARSAAPERWAGIYLSVQTLAQFVLAAVMTAWIEPGRAVPGDFGMLAIVGLGSAIASFALPSAFQVLPKPAGKSSLRDAAAAGSCRACVHFSAVDVHRQHLGLLRSHCPSSGLVVPRFGHRGVRFAGISGAGRHFCATLSAGRLRWFPVFVVCAAVDLGMIALLGTHLSAPLFLIDAAVFGFIWLFILPYLVPMVIEADPTRRSAVLTSGVRVARLQLGAHHGRIDNQPGRHSGRIVVRRRLSFVQFGDCRRIAVSAAAITATLRPGLLIRAPFHDGSHGVFDVFVRVQARCMHR